MPNPEEQVNQQLQYFPIFFKQNFVEFYKSKFQCMENKIKQVDNIVRLMETEEYCKDNISKTFLLVIYTIGALKIKEALTQ